MPLIRVNDLVLYRGERALCQALSFELLAGEVKLIKGRNGSGKSTLLRRLCGLSDAANHQGTVQAPAASECLYWAHDLGLKAAFTAVENLHVLLLPKTLPPTQTQAALHKAGLQERMHLPVQYLSAGQKRRILLARLALSRHKLWLLDEVSTALDDHASEWFNELLRDHLSSGGAALMVTHERHFDALGESVYVQPPPTWDTP
ncbi:MAG: cytochrome c biosis heme-transporting ATPase CcmA [Pseudomonadota bacterium]|jgi:heme exporter protein A